MKSLASKPTPRALRVARRVVRATRIVAGTLGLSLVWGVGALATIGSPRRSMRWQIWTLRAWARWMVRTTRIEITVHGEPPAGACLLVTNHVGYVDILVLASRLECVFVAAREIERWPVIGAMGRRMGTIYLDRGAKRDLPRAHAQIEAALAQGRSVVFFPEGANGPGDALRPFKPALFEVAARDRSPVAWAALHYATHGDDPPPSLAVAWYERPIVAQALDFLGLAKIDATLTFGPTTIVATDRKELAREAHDRVAQAFRPML